MHVLLDDDLGRLTVRRLRPWHRMMARGLAARLDRQLADGVPPEASAILAARATFLTSVGFRRALAASLRRILAASASPDGPSRPPATGVARRPYVPLRRDRIGGRADGAGWLPH
jgi:hypothetical protein